MKKLKSNFQSLAGLFLFIAGCIVFMGITSAESLYPEIYQTAVNEISDLGVTSQFSSFKFQPAATIFNLSMIITGFLILFATYGLVATNTKKVLTAPLTLFGIGVLGVGLFTTNFKIHALFAVMTFVFGAASALASTKVVSGPFKHAALALGLIALGSLVFYGFIANYLGVGGAERWVAYPNTLWMLGFGGYLLGTNRSTK